MSIILSQLPTCTICSKKNCFYFYRYCFGCIVKYNIPESSHYQDDTTEYLAVPETSEQLEQRLSKAIAEHLKH